MGTLAALEKLVPVVLVFGCGALFARRGVIDAASSKPFADFAFLFAVPCYLFGNIYRSDLGALFDWRALGGYVLAALGCMVLVASVAWRSGIHDPRRIALRIMAGVQVNTAYFAVPVFVMLFGTAAPIFPVLLLQVCVLTLVVLAVMEAGAPDIPQGASVPAVRMPAPPDLAAGTVLGSEGTAASRAGVGSRVARGIRGSLSTPLLVACNTGLLLNLLHVPLPRPALDAFAFVGDAASPVALFALGLHVGGAGSSLRRTAREEIWLVAVKCLVFPLAVWLVVRHVLGVDPLWQQYLVLIAAMPAPQNLFVFAQRYDVGVDLSAALVTKSSVTALVLLPVWIHWTGVM